MLAAALCFSTTGTAQALADVDAPAVAVGAGRIVVGGSVLGLIGLWAARSRLGRLARTAPDLEALRIVCGGVVGVVAYQPLFFAGTGENGVAVGTVVALGSAPVFTGTADAIRRRSIPSRQWLGATGIALAGLVVVSGVLGGADHLTVQGLLASAGAGASYAAYAVAAKALMDRGWHSNQAMCTLFGLAAAVGIPLLLASGTRWLSTPTGLALAVWLGVMTTVVAYLLFGWGLARLTAPTVSTLTLAEPLAATLFGLAVLHERLSPSSAFGLALISAGLALIAASARGGVGIRV
ncbi:MAG: EamA family transporter [Corynebacteriales bacterium]|nr:EamA family transporter [Mycobacteriales bacterium]